LGILQKANGAFSIVGRHASVRALEASSESAIANESADCLFFPLTTGVEAAREEGTNLGVSVENSKNAEAHSNLLRYDQLFYQCAHASNNEHILLVDCLPIRKTYVTAYCPKGLPTE
jgi:hypothetical protein